MFSLSGWFRKASHPRKAPPQRTFRPRCEALEARELLSSTPLPAPLPGTAALQAVPMQHHVHATPAHGPARLPQAATGSLVIGGQPMVPTNPHYAADYQALTGHGANRAEELLRVQIFNAMKQNPAFTFHFANLQQAEVNFRIRVAIIDFMSTVQKGFVPDATSPGQFSYFSDTAPATANPKYWDTSGGLPIFSTRPVGYALGIWPVYDNYQALLSIPQAPFRGECYSTASLAVLYGVARVLGRDAFNRMFPFSLTFGWGSLDNPSVLGVVQKYLTAPPFPGATAREITTRDMVPGDWVYMKNMNGYTGGAWNGENAIYIGKYSYKGVASAYFSGLGADNVT